MKIIQNTPNIVIIGAWNTAILNPNWLKEHFPDIISDNVRIEAGFGINSSLIYHLEHIKIIPSANRLLLVSKIDEIENHTKVKDLAKGIVEQLPHTPIISIGHNIAFDVTEKNINTFSNVTFSKEKIFYEENLNEQLVARNIKHSIATEKYLLNIEYKISDDNKTIDFNFHYDINSKDILIQSLNSFEENVKYSKKIINNLVS